MASSSSVVVMNNSASNSNNNNNNNESHNSQDEEIISSVPQEMFKDENFDTSHVMNKFKGEASAEEIDAERESHVKMLDAVSNKLSSLIMSSYGAFVQGMSQVHELGIDLQQSTMMCKQGRTYLNSLQTNVTNKGLTLLAKYKRKQVYEVLLDELVKIKSIISTEATMRRLLAEGDYPKAISLCLECQNQLQSVSQFQCLHSVEKNITETLRIIGDRMDRSLQEVCNSFHGQLWSHVLEGHVLMGRTSKLLERLTPCFVDSIEPHLKKIVKSHVILSESIATSPELLRNMRLKEMCMALEEENYLDCLLSVLEYLTDLMTSHFQMTLWVYNKKPKSEKIETGKLDDGNLYEDIYGILTRLSKSMWKTIEINLSVLVSSCKPTCKLEEFLRILEYSERFIHIGEIFSAMDAYNLRSNIKQQSKVFFEHYHKSRMEDLRTMLENDMWQRCPIPHSYFPLDITEFRASTNLLKSSDDILEKNHLEKNGKESDQSEKDENGVDVTNPEFYSLFKGLQEENPFGKILAEKLKPANTRNISRSLSVMHSENNTNDTHFDNNNLNNNNNSDNNNNNDGTQEGRLITSTTINVVRFIGKYLSIMYTLQPIAYDIFCGVSLLFEYYIYTIFVFFGTNPVANASLNKEKEEGSGGVQIGSMKIPGIQSEKSDRNLLMAVEDQMSTASTELKKMVAKLKSKFNPSISSSSSNLINGLNNIINTKVLTLSTVEVNARANLYGIRFRVLGLESMMFVAEAMLEAQPLLQKLIPPAKIDQVSQFYFDTVSYVKELRKLSYYNLAQALAVPIDAFVNQIANVKWDVKELGVEHSSYVDPLVKEIQGITKRLDDFSSPPREGEPLAIPLRVKIMLWESIVIHAMDCLVEGYSRAKKCTPEGRALMSLDLKNIQSGLEKLTTVRPIPNIPIVDTYIKAYYLPPQDIVNWFKEHNEYSLKQVTNLILCTHTNLKKSQRDTILKQIEEVDKARRR